MVPRAPWTSVNLVLGLYTPNDPVLCPNDEAWECPISLQHVPVKCRIAMNLGNHWNVYSLCAIHKYMETSWEDTLRDPLTRIPIPSAVVTSIHNAKKTLVDMYHTHQLIITNMIRDDPTITWMEITHLINTRLKDIDYPEHPVDSGLMSIVNAILHTVNYATMRDALRDVQIAPIVLPFTFARLMWHADTMEMCDCIYDAVIPRLTLENQTRYWNSLAQQMCICGRSISVEWLCRRSRVHPCQVFPGQVMSFETLVAVCAIDPRWSACLTRYRGPHVTTISVLGVLFRLSSDTKKMYYWDAYAALPDTNQHDMIELRMMVFKAMMERMCIHSTHNGQYAPMLVSNLVKSCHSREELVAMILSWSENTTKICCRTSEQYWMMLRPSYRDACLGLRLSPDEERATLELIDHTWTEH